MNQGRKQKCQESLREVVKLPNFSWATKSGRPTQVMSIDEVFRRTLPGTDLGVDREKVLVEREKFRTSPGQYCTYCNREFDGAINPIVDCDEWFGEYEELIKDPSKVLKYTSLIHPYFLSKGDIKSQDFQRELVSRFFGHYNNANPRFLFLRGENNQEDVLKMFKEKILEQYELSPEESGADQEVFIHSDCGLVLKLSDLRSFSDGSFNGMIWTRNMHQLPNGDCYDITQFEEMKRVLKTLQRSSLLEHGVYSPGEWSPFSVIFPHEGGNEK